MPQIKATGISPGTTHTTQRNEKKHGITPSKRKVTHQQSDKPVRLSSAHSDSRRGKTPTFISPGRPNTRMAEMTLAEANGKSARWLTSDPATAKKKIAKALEQSAMPHRTTMQASARQLKITDKLSDLAPTTRLTVNGHGKPGAKGVTNGQGKGTTFGQITRAIKKADVPAGHQNFALSSCYSADGANPSAKQLKRALQRGGYQGAQVTGGHGPRLIHSEDGVQKRVWQGKKVPAQQAEKRF